MFSVYKKRINNDLIDNLLNMHEVFKYSPLSKFRAQGTSTFEEPILDDYGNQKNAIHNPHLLGFSRNFRKSIDSIIYSQGISNSLKEFTGIEEHVHYTSMFFDKSTATKMHQDCWWLDTNPGGKLIGVWIALEDIFLASGPFCIYTGADSRSFKTTEYDFENLETDIKFSSDFPNSKRFEFLAKKGDVILWDSFSIHGALKPLDNTKTRKSLTSHFYPANALVKDPPVSKLISLYDHKNPKKTANINIKQAATISPYIYSFLVMFLMFSKPIQSLLMRDNLTKRKFPGMTNMTRINNKSS